MDKERAVLDLAGALAATVSRSVVHLSSASGQLVPYCRSALHLVATPLKTRNDLGVDT